MTGAQLRDSQEDRSPFQDSPPHPGPNLASQANFYSSFRAFFRRIPQPPPYPSSTLCPSPDPRGDGGDSV